jgi:hypothetical protein
MGNKRTKECQVKDEALNNKEEQLTNEDYEFFSLLTSFSKDKIKSIFEIFMDNNPNGELNKHDFIRLYCSLRPEPNEVIFKISSHVFDAFDFGKFINFKLKINIKFI